MAAKKKGGKRYFEVILDAVAPIIPIPDKVYLHLKYFFRLGKRLHLQHPKSFNEKLQWLKLYGRRPIDTLLSDKYAVKEFIAKKIGPEYVIPLLGVWDKYEDINFDCLPSQFVLKCTHDSGSVIICKDKPTFDFERAKRILNKGLKHDFYVYSREKAYRDIPRRIIAEEYVEDPTERELKDYKFFCFDGVPKVMFIASDRQLEDEETKFDFFDMDFHHLPFTNGHPNAKDLPHKPIKFEEMKAMAAILSKDIPHVRVDFYEVDGRVLFGEMTFSHWGGMMPFVPEEWDYVFGDWINLPPLPYGSDIALLC